ncbi:hypothetical protein AB0F91_43000 [Amycolatopsis sp. NPDC023774]|uniref:hypothetical protein n=1 Tax=Amycolatopsis sp. NPDC023774 TaxID=3155015 RepID=UPI0033CC2F5D
MLGQFLHRLGQRAKVEVERTGLEDLAVEFDRGQLVGVVQPRGAVPGADHARVLVLLELARPEQIPDQPSGPVAADDFLAHHGEHDPAVPPVRDDPGDG